MPILSSRPGALDPTLPSSTEFSHTRVGECSFGELFVPPRHLAETARTEVRRFWRRAIVFNFISNLTWLCRRTTDVQVLHVVTQKAYQEIEQTTGKDVVELGDDLVKERALEKRLTMHHVKMPPMATHHSKMLFLFPNREYPFVRICIVSGNFIEVDWRNKSQTVFVRDLPLLPDGKEQDRSDRNSFLPVLERYLTCLRPRIDDNNGKLLLNHFKTDLARFDFSPIDHCPLPTRLVVSSNNDSETGVALWQKQMQHALSRQKQTHTGKRKLRWLLQCSSIGANAPFLSSFKRLLTSALPKEDEVDFAVLLPTKQQMAACRLVDPDTYCTGIFIKRKPLNVLASHGFKFVSSDNLCFVDELFFGDYVGAPRPVKHVRTPHCKTFTLLDVTDPENPRVLLLLTGSHNFSPTAMGASNAPRSFEVSVLVACDTSRGFKPECGAFSARGTDQLCLPFSLPTCDINIDDVFCSVAD
ncbi:MAG: hypothetical protein MHM6MM_002754 [Cercozoa sp. M6MM]